MPRPKSVAAYIAAAPKAVRAKLGQLRRVIKSVAPQADEYISYGMPYYGYKGRLAYFRVSKSHLGLYIPPPVIAEHAMALRKYGTAMATVRFPLDEPLPLALIKKLIVASRKKNEAKAVAKKAAAPMVCSRGHKFRGPGPCPVCWPGRARKAARG